MHFTNKILSKIKQNIVSKNTDLGIKLILGARKHETGKGHKDVQHLASQHCSTAFSGRNNEYLL